MTRKRNLYKPDLDSPFKLSRSKLESFMSCPRCFYIDRVEGVSVPSGPPFTLNSAVDSLLKNEFDELRNNGKNHKIIEEYGLDAAPVDHPLLNQWRFNFKGVQSLLEEFNLLVFGAIDDLWINSKGEYIVVDYKATAKKDDITELTTAWHEVYNRQLEIYQWLIRRNGLKVSDTAYILYCNGDAQKPRFNQKLDFRTTLISHVGNDSWVYNTVKGAYKCLNGTRPNYTNLCKFCTYNKDILQLSEF